MQSTTINNKQTAPDEQEETNNNWKTGLLLVVLLLCFFAVVVRLFIVQVIKKNQYQSQARKQYESRIELKPERGIIYDRNGHTIASTIKGASYAVDPKMVEQPHAIAIALEQLTGDSASVWEHKIRSSNRSFLWLIRSNLDQSSVLDTLQDNGLIRIIEPRRNYY